MTASTQDERPCAVYRCYALDGSLDYIGSAFDPEQRLREHGASAEWARSVARRVDEWYPTEGQARTAELAAIKAERPRHNKVGLDQRARLAKFRELDQLARRRDPGVSIDRRPPYDLVAEYYRQAIRTGDLLAGDELPAVRRLAAEREIGTATAQRVLALLRDEGWISTRPGRPSSVAGNPEETTAGLAPTPATGRRC